MTRTGKDFASMTPDGVGPPHPEVIDRAKRVLEAWHRAGKLEPLPEWEHDPLGGYLDLLGLNGRKVRETRPFGKAY